MSRPALQGSLPVVFVGALLMLACGGAGSAEPSTSAGAGEHAGGAGAAAAGGASGAVAGSTSGGGGSAGSGGGSAGSGGGSAGSGGGSAGSAASTPGAGLDCASNDGSPLCAAGLLATRPCSFGPRVAACVCMAPCDSATDCGGASCVDIALVSGTKGSVCPPPDYTCAAP